MSDEKKKDDPAILAEDDLENIDAGMKIPNLFSGGGKIVDVLKPVESPTITARFTEDKLGNDGRPGMSTFPKSTK